MLTNAFIGGVQPGNSCNKYAFILHENSWKMIVFGIFLQFSSRKEVNKMPEKIIISLEKNKFPREFSNYLFGAFG